MKQVGLFLIVILLVSCVSLTIANSSDKQVIILTDGLLLIPDARFQVFFQDGRIQKGKSNKYGIIIVKTKKAEEYNLVLDLNPAFYSKKEWQDIDFDILDEILKNYPVDSFESIYINRTDSNELFFPEDGLYTLRLKNGMNYFLIYYREPYEISM